MVFITFIILIGSSIFIAGLVYLFTRLIEKIPNVSRGFLIAAVLGFFTGLVLTLNETQEGMYYESLEHWPRIEAEITKSAVKGNRAVLPEIEYCFTIESGTYRGKSSLGTPGFGGRNKRTLTARTIIADYPEGSAITVAYNPSNPSESTTQFHPPWNYYGKTGFGLFLILSSVLVILFSLFPKHR